MPAQYVRAPRADLVSFCQAIFQSLGLSEDDAHSAADVLVAADARGIPSHGVARLWRYVNGLRDGVMIPDAPVEVLADTPTSLVVHAHGAMGASVSVSTMRRVIDKARGSGAAFACIRDSNHLGIAGYYACMAMEAGMRKSPPTRPPMREGSPALRSATSSSRRRARSHGHRARERWSPRPSP